MPQNQKSATDVIGTLFDNAHRLQEEKVGVLADIDANRKALRTLSDAGALSDDQTKMLHELYPPRQKSENGAEAPVDPAPENPPTDADAK